MIHPRLRFPNDAASFVVIHLSENDLKLKADLEPSTWVLQIIRNATKLPSSLQPFTSKRLLGKSVPTMLPRVFGRVHHNSLVPVFSQV